MKVTVGSGNVTKVTVNTGANVVFAPATDRSPAAAITIGMGGSAEGTLAYNQANAAYNVANAAANTVRVSANSESTLSQKQLNFVNTASIQVTVEEYSGNANISFNTTGAAVSDAYNQANAARNQANTARNQANAAYSEANLKLNIAGGTITGNLTVSGNLEVLGNSTILNVETLSVEDNEIILNSNVTGAPALNAFITINRGTSPNVSLKWNEDVDQWQFTDDGTNFYSLNTGLVSYAQANNARDTANGAYSQANGAYGQANGAYAQANGAYSQANGAYTQANGAYSQANGAYAQANLAYGQANAAYDNANTRVLKAGDTMTGNLIVQANVSAYNVNVSNSLYFAGDANGGVKFNYDVGFGPVPYFGMVSPDTETLKIRTNISSGELNTDVITIDRQSQNVSLNGNLSVSGDIIPSANLSYNLGSPTNKFNDLFLGGNSVYIGDAVLSTNGDTVLTNTFIAEVSFLSGGLNVLNQANAAYDAANNAGINALNAYNQANTAYGQANVAYGQANTARDTANNAYDQANAARGQANTAYGQANAAYAEANLKLNLTGGTINGSLNVSGNLSITGNTTFYNVTTYVVDDPLIYIAANNKTSDLVDIGFIGAKNTAGQYNHTGFARDAGDGTWYLFDNLQDEGHQNNVIDFANTTLATLRANINANSILLVGNPVATQANLTLAHNQANTARNTANDSYSQANSARDQANTARDVANAAYTQANTSATNSGNAYDQANNARNQANTAYGQANSARDQANTARTTANDAYGQANSARGQANTAYGQANLAYAQANAAYSDSNTRVLKAGDTMTGALTITTSGIGLTVANANVTGNLNVGTQIVTGGASGDISGVNTIYAGTFSTGTINVTAQAANAYDQANSARNQANTAYGQGNSAYTQANSARDQANTAYGQANTARTTANDSYGQANSARDQANTARNTANDAYGQANSSYTVANSAANTVRVSQNGSSTLASKQLNFVNTSSIIAIVTDALDGNANIEFTTTGASAADAYNQANAARDQANTARDAANNATVRVSANSGAPITSNTFVFNNSSTIAVTVSQSGSNANISFSSTGGGVEYTYNTTTSSIETVDTFPAATYRSAKYQMQVEGLYGFAALEIMLLHDGSSANIIEFGKTTLSGNVGVFSTDINNGNVRLRFTGTDESSFLTYYRSLLSARGSESLPTDLMTGTNIYDLMLGIPISPTDLNA